MLSAISSGKCITCWSKKPQAEIGEAFAWYLQRSPTAAGLLLDALAEAMTRIELSPEQSPVIPRPLWRVLLSIPVMLSYIQPVPLPSQFLMFLTLELEQEADGRWIAEIPDLAGVVAYGNSRDEATARVEALALRVLADRLKHGEAGPGLIVLETAERPRAGWVEAARRMASRGDDALVDPGAVTRFDDEEWEWP